VLAKMREEAAVSARRAAPVGAVVKAVEHALTADKPSTRYLVGAGTRLMLLLNLLPDRWRDRLILSRLDG
jgi:hypothetical protein